MAVMIAASLAPLVVSAESPREASQGETPPFDPCGVSGSDGVSRNFPQTGGWDVNGSFLTYWEELGGLELFGYPLTPQIQTEDVVIQYFERARVECHTTEDGGFQMLGGLLGRASAEDCGLLETEPFLTAEPIDSEACSFYEESGHNLCGGFRAYWENYGGLQIYGYPISEEFTDPDSGLTVQYFERQRYEWHPGERPERYDILLGRLGAEYLQNHLKPADAAAPAAGTCGEAQDDVVTMTIRPDVPGPRCMIVSADQRLNLVNDSGGTVTVGLSYFVFSLEQGESRTFDLSFGQFLEPGVHRAAVDLYLGSGPEVWLGGPQE